MRRRSLWIIPAVALLAAAAILWRQGGPPARDATSSEKSDAGESVVASLSPEQAFAALPAEKDPAQRRELVKAMARGKDPASQLEAAYSSVADNATREQVLIEASRVGTARGVRFLAAVAASDPVLGARAGAALRQIRDREAAPELAQLARADGPVIVRANAARALGEAGSREYVTLLADLSVDPAQPLRVRQESALALAALADRTTSARIAAALDAAAADASPDGEQLRIAFLRALGAAKTIEARQALERHAQRALGETERVVLRQVLGGDTAVR